MIKKSLCLILLLLLSGGLSYGTQIVYPRNSSVTINSDKTFFIGNEKNNREILINGEVVNVHPSGGFKHPVQLDYGKNIFVIDNGEESQTYTIIRPQQVKNTDVCFKKPVIYDKPFVVSVIKNKTPLRSTPVDAGLNRLQHLPVDIKFEAIGEERGFYKVKLGRDGFGFISKDSAQKLENETIEFAKVGNIVRKNENGEFFIEISLDKKVPYTVTDNNDGLDIVVYNVKNSPYGYLQEHIQGKPFGFMSYYNDEGSLVIIMKEFPKINLSSPLKNIKIALDAGHGGSETGTIGCLGTLEKDLNLEISKILKQKLENLGADVFLIRDGDSFVELNDRVEKSNYFNADIFLSIHNNALPDSLAYKEATGTETYYFYPQSKELAKILAGTISDKTGLKNNGFKGQSFAVIRNTQSISVLIEIGYLINPNDNANLIDKNFQQKVTDGIIEGLERFLKK